MNDNDLTPQAAIRTAAFSHAPAAPSPPTIPTSAPTAPPTVPAVPIEPHSHAGISETEHAAMVGWARQDVASGKLSPEAAAKLFDELGVPPDQRTMPTDLRDEEQRLVDAHFPAAKPEDYQIRYADPGQPAPPMTPEMKQFDQSARSWLSGAEFPRDIGNSLVTAITKTAQQTKAMNENQLEEYGYAEYQKLERAHGEKLDERLKKAGEMVEQLENATPGLKNLLRSKGIGDNALIASMLIGQSERYWARRKGP
jgi:hypothetical protein